MEPQTSSFECTLQVRGYELDGFNHVNHAVYLNYFEQARYLALEAGGMPLGRLLEEGWGIHVVRVEVDYRRELLLGDKVMISTRVERWKHTSMILHQIATREVTGEVAAEARVTAVWIGEDGKPMRIPPVAQTALGRA